MLCLIFALSLSTVGHCGLDLQRAHRDLLKRSGWLEFVERNIDEVVYVDEEYRWLGHWSIVGFSEVRQGRRVATVYTRNHSVLFNAASLVHEAKHLEGHRLHRVSSSQAAAFTAEKAFFMDYLATKPFLSDAEDLNLFDVYGVPRP